MRTISKLLNSPPLPRKWNNLGTPQTPAEELRTSALPLCTLAINRLLGESPRVFWGKVVGLQRVQCREHRWLIWHSCPGRGVQRAALPLCIVVINRLLGESPRVFRGKGIGLQRVPVRQFLQTVVWLFVGALG